MDRPTQKTFRDAFSRLSDDEWYNVLQQSVHCRVIEGVDFPGFPPDDVQVRMVGSSNANALYEADRFYRFVKEECTRHNRPLTAESRVLDFGVGWGRVIRFFLKDVDSRGLYGVDVNEDFIALCRETGVVGDLSLIHPVGSLPYEARTFDLVYAYSVFTHLPERVADIWLAELTRVLQPGGVLIATVEPRRFLDFCKSITPQMAATSSWHRTLSLAFAGHPSPFEEYETQGIVYLSASPKTPEDLYGDTVLSPEYVATHWGRYLDIKTYLDEPGRFWQAVVVAQKRSV